MPATNRGPTQLTPASTSTRDYLSGLPPIWATIEASLAIFALYVILRSCVRHCYSWFQASRRSKLALTARYDPWNHHQSELPALRAAWEMDEKIRSKGIMGAVKGQHVSFREDGPLSKRNLAVDPHWRMSSDSVPRQLMTRPPPAPPLTPPELSTAVFTFEDRPHSQESFIHQPNPDYTSSTPSSMSQRSSASPSTPKKRSYNKTLPIGVPTNRQSSSLSEHDPADLTLSSSSYPPTSPLLPPAPPELQAGDSDGTGPREIGVKGQIFSVLDGDGAGWTRHTRVYGGGVCLACAASGGDHGAGGFYGATVSPEEMR